MSWIIAFVGFATLVVLHELGHFAAAKAVGMRVERFSLFFGPMLAKFTRGETTYGIGPIPLGGYVKITGMNPAEDIPPEHAHRAYYRQPVWKRIVVIVAGPVVNIVLAFLILWPVLTTRDYSEITPRVNQVERGSPAAGVLQPGDVIVAVDGVRGSQRDLADQIATHTCRERRPTEGCRAAEPAELIVERSGGEQVLSLRPLYDAELGRPRAGLQFTPVESGAGRAAERSVEQMWAVTAATATVISRLFEAEQRKQLSGVVGSYETTRQATKRGATTVLLILALISFSLGLINLLPFLPLDGGHIFWALAEKVTGRTISFRLMEKASVIGIALVGVLFVIGLQNDVGRLQGEGFGLR